MPADGARPEGPDGQIPPEGFGGEMPTWPAGEAPNPPGSHGPSRPEGTPPGGEGQIRFYMQDKVNFFSGLNPAQ